MMKKVSLKVKLFVELIWPPFLGSLCGFFSSIVMYLYFELANKQIDVKFLMIGNTVVWMSMGFILSIVGIFRILLSARRNGVSFLPEFEKRLQTGSGKRSESNGS